MRLTVVGHGPAEPQPDSPASGLLVRAGSAAILLDCGPGVVGALSRLRDPRALDAIVVSHLHFDHYLDLVGLRYLFPWAGTVPRRLVVAVPPGGRARFAALATAISERASFFEEAFDLREYDPSRAIRLPGLELRFVESRHYVPTWGVALTDAAGARLVYSADTGPSKRLTAAAEQVDLLVCEATLEDAGQDDLRRGHLTAGEAIGLAIAARARSLLLTHFPSARRPELEAIAAGAPLPVLVARPGLTVDVTDGAGLSAGAA